MDGPQAHRHSTFQVRDDAMAAREIPNLKSKKAKKASILQWLEGSICVSLGKAPTYDEVRNLDGPNRENPASL